MTITTYQSAKAWPDKRWLAHLDLGKGIYCSFFAPTEEAAIAKANSWYEHEKERWARVDKSNAEAQKIAKDLNDEPGTMAKGRGAHLVGMVWMINAQAEEGKKKIRVPESEQKLWEGRGYFKGGARTLV